ncbi:MAG: YdbL family protein [Pseudomonadota bacterium]
MPSQRHISRRIRGFFLIACLLAWPAVALDIHEAKAKGLIGETSSGYLAAVKPSSQVDALVNNINAKRRNQYQKIADQNKITLEQVEARAGLKAIEKTPAGEYVNTGAGWQKK